MPETMIGISFDKDGVCNFCRDWQKPQLLGEQALEEIISSIKKKNNKYDCIVPLSGGRDSTFVLYIARKKFDLKVLAVNYDNEFSNEQTVKNMKTACELLNADLISIRSKRNVASKMVRDAIRMSALKSLPPNSFCRACSYGFQTNVYRMAKQHKAPLILWGSSSAEKTLHLTKEAFKILRPPKTRLQKLCNLANLSLEYHALLQRLEFPMPGRAILDRGKPVLKEKDIREIKLFDYIPWDRRKIKDTIINELGWRKPQGNVSTWRGDCSLYPLISFSYFKLFGCTKHCFGYINMINSGNMEREEALYQEKAMIANITHGLRELLEGKIGFSKKEATRILSFQKNEQTTG
jgi:hypothetical protein